MKRKFMTGLIAISMIAVFPISAAATTVEDCSFEELR